MYNLIIQPLQIKQPEQGMAICKQRRTNGSYAFNGVLSLQAKYLMFYYVTTEKGT